VVSIPFDWPWAEVGRTSRLTIIARSLWKISQAMNTATTATNPTNNPMTWLLFQGCVCPPYCSASMYDTIRLIMRAAPIRSI
jgi:hypothetical protein